MERKVGEIFEIDGILLKVIEQHYDGYPKCPCEDCYFNDGSHKCYYPRVFNIIGKCSGRYIRNEGHHVIFVKIEDMETRNVKLSLEKAKEFYAKGGEFKDLALSAFTEEELTKKELPKTWEEYALRPQGTLYYTHIGLMTPQDGEAHAALSKLHHLRDCYRQGWKPNFNDKNVKHCIKVKEDYVYLYTSMETSHFLSFQTTELALKFMDNFRDLIIEAGDLI